MSNIKTAFSGGKALIAFLTAGDPDFDKTEEYILAMADAGADLIEIGIPFSDPTAEGKVIQAANIRALAAGATTDRVFETVKNLRKKTDIPLVLLTYLNPVFVYGYERFFKKCGETGIDGMIIPDLPFEESGEVFPYTEKNGVDLISLIAPTSENRIAEISKGARGYIYLVSSMGVTGVRSEIKTDLSALIKTVRSNTDIPVCVGFGISTPEQAAAISRVSDGVIIGSAIVKIIEEYGRNAAEPLRAYVKKIKESMRHV